MRDQEILSLQEAYQQVCESSMILEDEMEGDPYPKNPDGTQMTWEQRRKYYGKKKGKKVQEEVEISSQYFYEMGLNEDGVEILIEELGLAKFVEYVYDLAEEYYLIENATSEAPSKPKRTRTRKKTTPATQTARQTAVDTAVKAQPKKRPVLDAIARAVTSGIERHNTAMRLAGETGKAAGKVLGGAGRVLGGAASGALGTAGMVHHAATRGLEPTPEPASEKPKPKPRTRRKPAAKQTASESFDLFDTILEYLVAEGFADTNENALVIMANMSEEWRESIVEETLYEKKGERPKGLPYGPVGKGFRKLTIPQRARMIQRGKEHTRAAMNSGEEYSRSHAASSAIDSALTSRRLGGRG